MSRLIGFFVEAEPGFHLFVGSGLLVGGTVLGPLIAGLVMRWTITVNNWIGGPFLASIEVGGSILKAFFAISLGLMAIIGTIKLVIYALAMSGLIESPWR